MRISIRLACLFKLILRLLWEGKKRNNFSSGVPLGLATDRSRDRETEAAKSEQLLSCINFNFNWNFKFSLLHILAIAPNDVMQHPLLFVLL